MELSGKDGKQIQDAFLDAFNTDELKQMVRFQLDEELENVVSLKSPLSTQVFELIEWAERGDRVSELIYGAIKANSTNAKVLELANMVVVGKPPIRVPKLSEDQWRVLLYRIRQGRCTPFLGPATRGETLLDESAIAQRLARKQGHGTTAPANLGELAQSLSSSDRMSLRQRIAEELDGAPRPDFAGSDEPHAILASLPLPVFVTTTFDDLLFLALQARDKVPEREFCRWNRQLEQIPSVFDDHDYFPTVQRPVVFHLFGHSREPQSMAVARDDLDEILRKSSRRDRSIPLEVASSFAIAMPLFLGHTLSHERFRVLMRVLVDYFEINVCRPPGKFKVGAFYVPNYLAHQFEDSSDGSGQKTVQALVAELGHRWEHPKDE